MSINGWKRHRIRSGRTRTQHGEAELNEVIAKIAACQQSDGYLNSYFTLVEPTKRWQNLGMMHELYCAGHLFEAAVAHYQATGKQTLLDVACRFADLIDNTFGFDKRDGLPGHEGIELALVKLARVTGEPRYMALSEYFVTRRGHSPSIFEKELENPDLPGGLGAYQHHFTRDRKFEGHYAQAHLPIQEQTECVGHAVRAMYLYSGAADIAYETGDTAITDALEALWENVGKRLYITGGVGPSGHNEGFTTDYELPNFSAYAETCASIGLIFWAHRMFLLREESRFVDVLETALYNGALSGISLDGTGFFYQNPLASHGDRHRHEWFGCACCPPNIARLLASVGQYIYAESEEGIYVNLYVGSTADAIAAGNVPVRLTQETDYPWSGDVTLTITPTTPVPFTLNLRIPGWSDQFEVRINGEADNSNQTLLAISLSRVNGALATVWNFNCRCLLDASMRIRSCAKTLDGLRYAAVRSSTALKRLTTQTVLFRRYLSPITTHWRRPSIATY